jgi:hypothetical protein
MLAAAASLVHQNAVMLAAASLVHRQNVVAA